MDFKSLSDFNKYTLALAAGGFIYSLEKFVPMPSFGGRVFLLLILVALLVSAFFGIAIFAATTAAMHGDEKRKESIKKRIKRLGLWHSGLLALGMFGIGVLLLPRVALPPLCGALHSRGYAEFGTMRS